MSQSVPAYHPKNRATDIERTVQNRSNTRERVSLSVTPDINCLLVVPHWSTVLQRKLEHWSTHNGTVHHQLAKVLWCDMCKYNICTLCIVIANSYNFMFTCGQISLWLVSRKCLLTQTKSNMDSFISAQDLQVTVTFQCKTGISFSCPCL